MTKKTFLIKLEKALEILDDKEVDKVIERYAKLIDDEIKNGKKEKVAVADLGTVEEVAQKVLKDHKINKSYTTDNKVERFLTDFVEGMVKFFRGIFDDMSEKKLSQILMDILYVVVALIILSMLLWFVQLPFEIAKEIVLGIINMGNDSIFSVSLGYIWLIFINIAGLIASIIVIIVVVKKIMKYFETNKKEFEIEDVKPIVKEIKEKIQTPENEKAVNEFFSVFTKLFVIIFMYIPLIMFNFGLAFVIGALIYFMVIGLYSIGLTMIVLGKLVIVVTMTVLLTRFLTDKVNKDIKNYVAALLIGFILIICGLATMIIEMLDYEYIDTLPVDVAVATETYNYNLNGKVFYFSDNDDSDVTITEDETLERGKIQVNVSYYNHVCDLKMNESLVAGGKTLLYYSEYSVYSPEYLYEFTIEGLKEKRVYNYDLFDDIKIRVYVNPLDINFVRDYDVSDSDVFYLKDETVICASALEEIARDDDYIYYLDCIKSETIYLIYANGTKISVRTALTSDQVTIYELIAAGLDVYKEPVDGSL